MMAYRFINRRNVLKIGAAAAAAPYLLLSNTSLAQSGKPYISSACYRVDRTEALFDERVGIEGARATFTEAAIGDMNTAAFSGAGTYGITEIGLNPFIIAYANDDFRDYALLPVFLLRQFRHKSVFIRTDRGIESPADLKGRRIGTPGYASTSLTWIRGIFEDEYGLKPADIEWVVSAADSSAGESGAASKQERLIPEGVSFEIGPAGMDESDLLVSGEVDALFHAATPRAYFDGNPVVGRLFADFRTVEQDYFRRTGIFPIMHAVAIRRDLAAAHPWLAEAAFKAFAEAKSVAYRTKDRFTWAADMLPWYSQELENTRRLMGGNFYSYGITDNRRALETLFGYAHRQGLASRQLTIEEAFLPASMEFREAGE